MCMLKITIQWRLMFIEITFNQNGVGGQRWWNSWLHYALCCTMHTHTLSLCECVYDETVVYAVCISIFLCIMIQSMYGSGSFQMHNSKNKWITVYMHTYIHAYIHTCIHTCLLLLISMLWHRQAIFESKGDKLSSSAEGRIRTQGLRYLFTSRLNACWQTDWAIEDQAKNFNSTARPYDQQAFSPLDLTANWLSHLALAIYMFVVVNFDALAQASDIRIERRQVVFLCWRQDSNPRSQIPIHQQTECLLINRLSYRGSS